MVNTASTESMAATRDIQLMNRVDFHTHVLPGIDDGSQSESQSYRILKMEKNNGVAIVLATPHFYPDGPTPTESVKTRTEAYEKLMAYAKADGGELPSIKQGAEVLLCTETADLEDLRALAIEGTDYILIEMPYSNWQPWVYEAIERIQVKHGLIPIIAHVERYVPMHTDTDQIYKLLTMPNVLGQMNTRSIMNKATRRLCHKMLECGMVHVIGSDAHRGQHLLEVKAAYEQIIQKHGIELVRTLDQQAQAIIQNEKISREMPVPFKRILGRFYQ